MMNAVYNRPVPADFVDYNESVFPAQIIHIGAAAAAFLLVLRPIGDSNRVVSMVLALLWLWTGIVYYIIFVSEIDPAAWLFGILFIVNAVLIFNDGVLNEHLKFDFSSNTAGIAGTFFVIFSLLIYPAIGFLIGREFPGNPTFAALCPITIYTIGMLMLTVSGVSLKLLWIPLVWSALLHYLWGYSKTFSSRSPVLLLKCLCFVLRGA